MVDDHLGGRNTIFEFTQRALNVLEGGELGPIQLPGEWKPSKGGSWALEYVFRELSSANESARKLPG